MDEKVLCQEVMTARMVVLIETVLKPKLVSVYEKLFISWNATLYITWDNACLLNYGTYLRYRQCVLFPLRNSWGDTSESQPNDI